MPYTAIPIGLGRLNWNPIAAQFEAVRDWVNDIPSADIVNASVQREHLIRPVLGGFPLQGLRGQFQGAYYQTFGLAKGDVGPYFDWGPLPERVTIVPSVVGGVDSTWWTPIGRSIYSPFAGDVEVDVSFQLLPTGPAKGPTPTFDGLVGGWFSIHHVWEGGEQEQINSRRHISPVNGTFAGRTGHDKVHLAAAIELQTGSNHLVVVYHKGGAPVTLWQLDLTRISASIEVLA